MNQFKRHIYRQDSEDVIEEAINPCNNTIAITDDISRLTRINIPVQYSGSGNVSVGYKAGNNNYVYRVSVLDPQGNILTTTNFRKNSSNATPQSLTQPFDVFKLTDTLTAQGQESLTIDNSDYATSISTDRILNFNKITSQVEEYTIQIDFTIGSSTVGPSFMLSLPCAARHIVSAYSTTMLDPNENHCGFSTEDKFYFLSDNSSPDLLNLPISSLTGGPTNLYKDSALSQGLMSGIFYLDYDQFVDAETIEFGAEITNLPAQNNYGKLIGYVGPLQCNNSKTATFYYESVVTTNTYKGANSPSGACSLTLTRSVYLENTTTAQNLMGKYLYSDQGLTQKIVPDDLKFTYFSITINTVKKGIILSMSGQVEFVQNC